MKKIVLSILFSAFFFSSMAQYNEAYREFHPLVHSLWESLSEQDYGLLETRIHKDFSYKGYKGDMATMIMKQVVEGYPLELEEIVINSVKETEGAYQLETTFKLAGKTDEDHILRISKDMQLLQAEVVNIQMGGHGGNEEEPVAEETYFFNQQRPDKVELPLILKGRNMFVGARINGREGLFYFDTGAPSLILNKAAYAPGELEIIDRPAESRSGATGAVEDIDVVRVGSLEMAGLEARKVEGHAYDLAHLDKDNIGMIGMDVMKGYFTRFDLKNSKVEFFKLDADGNVKDQSALEGLQPVEIRMMGHLPVITVEVAGEKLNLAIDSGGGAAMIKPKYKSLLAGAYRQLENDVMRGQGKAERVTEVFSLNQMTVGAKTIRDVRVLFESLAGSENHKHEFEVDGLIGWDLFYQSVVGYNLDKNLIYLDK